LHPALLFTFHFTRWMSRAPSVPCRTRYLLQATDWRICDDPFREGFCIQNHGLPVGRLTLVASDTGLAAVLWENDNPKRVPLTIADENASHPVLRETERQLKEYFARTRNAFDLPLDFQGTDFQKRVWAQLLAIPFGQTRSYGQIARALGNPNAMRAVGAANGRNPISIIAPCHRVIGANGKLTGFAGGLEAKVHLLTLEARPTMPRAA
jgi:methylated-DNA-[protein]-cysteine S-methyltransferase